MAQNIYYIHKNGKQVGPVSIDVLQNMVKANELTQTDLVWIKNSPSWVKAGSLQELFPTAPPLPDPDQAVVYQHNETLISSGNKEDLKWYSIGGAGLFIGLVLLASTSRNFSLVKTRGVSEDMSDFMQEHEKQMKEIEKSFKDSDEEIKKREIENEKLQKDNEEDEKRRHIELEMQEKI